MKMTSSQFEKELKELQASWAFEGQALTAAEADQLRMVCTGQISKAQYDAWLQEKIRTDRHE